MATRTTVTLVDDLDGATAEESVRFGLDGEDYEIDLSGANAAALRDTLADYISAARRRDGRSTTPRRTASPAAVADKPGRSREENQLIRTWAVEHGAFVPERGRIPGLMVTAYEANDPSMLPAAAADGNEEPRGRDGLTATEREVVRAWAVEEGIEVKGRGQLKKDLIANYRSVTARRPPR